MDPTSAAFFRGLTGFVVLAGTIMGGTWLWFNIRAKYRSVSSSVIDALRDENARLEAELGSRMAELEDRVDFVERRLVQGKPPVNLPPKPERTPV